MITDYIALLPEITLSLGIIIMLLIRLLGHFYTPKTFYKVCRNFMLIAFIFSILFYNQNVGAFLHNNYFTTLFKSVIYLLSFVWGALSVKRFVSKNMPDFTFYEMMLFNMLCFSTAVSATNLLIFGLSLSLSFVGNIFLLAMERNRDEQGNYRLMAVLTVVVMAIGLSILYYYFRSFDYELIMSNLGIKSQIIWPYHLAFALIICSLIFMLGIAPLHFWFAEAVGNAILPVSGYLSIVPLFAYFACLVNVCANVFYPLLGWFNQVFMAFGVLSVLIGAIGANSENNLRKIFAYSGLYYLGVTMLTLFPLNDRSLLASFVYLTVYVVAVCGIYTVFFGYRSKGEYIKDIDGIKGVATQRPFLSAALLVFMISLIGTPPLLGFLGKLSVINSLVVGRRFALIAVVLSSMLILIYAYLKIITVVYFEPRHNNFDKVDKGVYICLLINILLILIAIINPKYLMYDVELMLKTVFE